MACGPCVLVVFHNLILQVIYHYFCHILLVIQTWESTIKGCEYQKAGITEDLFGGCPLRWRCCHVAIHVRSKGLTCSLAPFYRLPLTNNKSKQTKSSLTLHERKEKPPLEGSWAGVSLPSAAPWSVLWWISGIMGMRKWGLALGLKRKHRKKPNTDSNLTQHSFSYISEAEKHSPGIHVFTLVNDYFQ